MDQLHFRLHRTTEGRRPKSSQLASFIHDTNQRSSHLLGGQAVDADFLSWRIALSGANGASVFPINIQKEGMAGLGDWLMQEEITVYNSVPSIFRQFAKSLRGDERFPKLRLIRFTGEALYRADVDLYKKYCCESCIVVNRLSSNEVPAFRQYFINHSTVLTDSVVPVGYSIGGYDVLLIGADGQEVGINEIGEIAVKSRHLAPGYWRNPDLTQAKFSSAPGERTNRIFSTGDMGRMNRRRMPRLSGPPRLSS